MKDNVENKASQAWWPIMLQYLGPIWYWSFNNTLFPRNDSESENVILPFVLTVQRHNRKTGRKIMQYANAVCSINKMLWSVKDMDINTRG